MLWFVPILVLLWIMTIAGPRKQAHQQATHEVDRERAPREAGAELAQGEPPHLIAKPGAGGAAEHDEEEVRHGGRCSGAKAAAPVLEPSPYRTRSS